MPRVDIKAQVLAQASPARDIFLLSVAAPGIAQSARPGQFCMLDAVEHNHLHDPLLRRPLSIHNVTANGTVEFLYRKTGRGTALLSQLKPGRKLKILGPLGNGFRWDSNKSYILVGGGMGIAPLLFLAGELHKTGNPPVIILGAATESDLVRIDLFQARTMEQGFFTATEDGSLGHHGLVTEVLVSLLDQQAHQTGGADSRGATVVLTCGPFPMMRAVAAICRERGIPCQVSLEAHMACGSGLCLGCAVESEHDAGYIHVCREGPVVDAEKVQW